MKALSIRQPWAWAILHAGKRIENRDWRSCYYRGPILIHASKSVGTRSEFDAACRSVLGTDVVGVGGFQRDVAKLVVESLPRCSWWAPKDCLQRGGIIGRASIVGTIDNSIELARAAREAGFDFAQQAEWWMGGFALVLADVQPLPFIPFKGSLGFFEVPDEVVR
jgi:hypothetical protein